MSSPDCSIVIPAHNTAPFIGEAISSILSQDVGFPYEVIVVDNGSTDRTVDVARGYGDRVRVVGKSDRGPASARNLGVALARSDLILFLDSDDKALPGRLARQVGYMLARRGDIDLCFGNCIVEGEPDNYLARYGLTHRGDDFTAVGDAFERLLVRGSFVPTSTSAVWRRAYVDGGMQPEGRFYAEDYTLWCNIAARGGRISYTGANLAWYRTARPGRLTFSAHTHAGPVAVLHEMLVGYGARLSPGVRVAVQQRFEKAAESLLRRDWADGGRQRVLSRLSELAPLLPPRLSRKWETVSFIPPIMPRTAWRGLQAAKRLRSAVNAAAAEPFGRREPG